MKKCFIFIAFAFVLALAAAAQETIFPAKFMGEESKSIIRQCNEAAARMKRELQGDDIEGECAEVDS